MSAAIGERTERNREGERREKARGVLPNFASVLVKFKREMCAVNSQNFQPCLAVYLSEN